MGESTTAARSGSTPPGQSTDDVVEVRLPATAAYVPVLRTLVATLASRLRFTIDEIEDLRIAVDEACSMIVVQADTNGILTAGFEISGDALEVVVSVPAADGTVPARDTFGWTVLSALAGGLDAGAAEGQVWIRLHKQRQYDPTQNA